MLNRYQLLTLASLLATTASAQVTLRHLGERAQLEVNNQPMLILGGELSNSAATSARDIEEVLPRTAALGVNTILVPAQWDLIEPEEGEFDFSTIDATIRTARTTGQKVVFLWFGAWKNSMSCYAPMWFKTDTRRFPRAKTRNGKPLEIASAFSERVFEADQRAFTRLMQHIHEVDATEHTVVMIQIENEIGMLEDARDHSELAEKAWKSPIPSKLLKALHKKQGGTWGEVLGNTLEADEQFMAWHYGCYVERLAQTARRIHDVPLYVNAAMNSRGRKPGEYPSAGPLAHLATIWKCAAPSVDILAPDIYDTGFKSWAGQYAFKGNPLFIPESRCCENSGVRALYAFGEHEAVGFSPFAIDQSSPADGEQVRKAYRLLNELSPLLLKYRGKGAMHGVLFSQEDKDTTLVDGNLTMTCSHYFTLPWDARANDGSTWREGGAVILKLAPNDYLVAGSGVVVVFQSNTEKAQAEQRRLGEDGFVEAGSSTATINAVGASPTSRSSASSAADQRFSGKRIGIGTVDEVTVDSNGQLHYLRRLNGDQDHQGRHVRISVDDYQILHVRLYEY